MHLRPYQELALSAIDQSWQRVDRTLVQMATGAGKTVVLAEVLKRHLQGSSRQGWVLVHRGELLHQTVSKIRQVWPDVDLGIWQRQRREVDAQVVVASLPSLFRHLEAFQPRQLRRIGVVIVDEAHHAPARSWQNTINTLTAQGSKCLGLTATPERNRRVGLGDVFEELCFSCSLADLVPDYLCDLRALRIQTELSLDPVRSRQGDFVVADLDQAINTPGRNQLIVEAWIRYGESRPAVVYCVSVAHALALAETFTQFGIRAGAVHGQQPERERQRLLEQFLAGALPILTNCLVLTEGWDCPPLSCLIMARPTQSSLLFMQMLGRGTRLWPEKPDCLILDIADNTQRHAVQTVHRLFGFAEEDNLHQTPVIQRMQQRAQAAVEHLRQSTLNRMDAVLVSLLGSEAQLLPSRFAWTPLGKESWFIKIHDQEPDFGGDLLQIHYTPDRGASFHHVSGSRIRELAAAPALPHLVEIADDWIQKHLRFMMVLLDQEADWRKQPASELQRSYIRNLLRRIKPENPELFEQLKTGLDQLEAIEPLQAFYQQEGSGIPESCRKGLTKGLASHLITYLKAQLE